MQSAALQEQQRRTNYQQLGSFKQAQLNDVHTSQARESTTKEKI